MRVHCESTYKYESRALAARGPFEPFEETQAREHAQQDGQRVTTCLLRITNMKGVNAEQRRGDQSSPPSKHPAAQEIDCGDCPEGKHNRQCPNEPFAAAKVQPTPQKHIVERHVGF